MIDYSLGKDATGPVTLEIKDAQGNMVRRYASTDPIPPPDPKLKIPRYWVRPPQVLSDQPGLHRFSGTCMANRSRQPNRNAR